MIDQTYVVALPLGVKDPVLEGILATAKNKIVHTQLLFSLSSTGCLINHLYAQQD